MKAWLLGIACICAALGLSAARMAHGAGAVGAEPSGAAIRVELDAGTLNLQARDAPLPEVLSRIGAQAGFDLAVAGAARDFPRVTVSYIGVPVRTAVERLLRDANSVIVYRAQGAGQTREIAEVRLLGARAPMADADSTERANEPSGGEHEQGPARRRSAALLRQARRGHAADVGAQSREQALAELAQSLRADPEAIVRARAALALGALGDERALPALASVLTQERSFSVRMQTVTAIGQIGGAQAIAILGGILLDSSANRTERLTAAQALWRQDSPAARQFLNAGAQDSDAQVRKAARVAPRGGARPGTTERQGPASVR